MLNERGTEKESYESWLQRQAHKRGLPLGTTREQMDIFDRAAEGRGLGHPALWADIPADSIGEKERTRKAKELGLPETASWKEIYNERRF